MTYYLKTGWGDMYRQSYPYIIYQTTGKENNKDNEGKEEKSKESQVDVASLPPLDLLSYLRENQSVKEYGLFFTSFSKSLREMEEALDRMCGKYAKVGDGGINTFDNIFNITTSQLNAFFYVPSLPQLQVLLTPFSDSASTTIVQNLNDWIDCRQSDIENGPKCDLSVLNKGEKNKELTFAELEMQESLCSVCTVQTTFLTDKWSQIMYCFGCGQITMKATV
ncbi:hypothetical protein RFI_28175 [Reticulomyxa filosa]|uniref:Uncharacterized protein n=1 Tax=Reticulomyxa filosa TaxID=46433 RepID=X6M5L1_RETFI|nr:hypothetical protein RFI_28175 [Reticulomyxa filosa]|eukprot:ETO09214.1 hypothetical protein RFI_28175 [Reticulomyxa filosa]